MLTEIGLGETPCIVCTYVQLMCEESDLKEMGLPLGPRKKLLSHLHQLKHEQVVHLSIVSDLMTTQREDLGGSTPHTVKSSEFFLIVCLQNILSKLFSHTY